MQSGRIFIMDRVNCVAEDEKGPLSRQGERFVKMSLIYWWHIVLKFKAIESMGNLL